MWQYRSRYEVIWDHGGQGWVSIDDTQAFEVVVSAFSMEWEFVTKSSSNNR
jgi:hypothetical protein